MRYHAARMHKKAVRRARQERHRLRQRRRFAKHVPASPRFVMSHAQCARRGRKNVPLPIVSLAAQRKVFMLEANGPALFPWLLLLALAVPTALNQYFFSRPRANALHEETSEALPFNELQPSPSTALDFVWPERKWEAQNAPTLILPRANSSFPRLPLRLEPLPTDTLPLNLFDEAVDAPQRLHWDRLIAVHAVTLGVGVYGLNYMNGIFGGVAQPFEIGNDWNKDHFMHFDELLHVQGAYRITQAVSGVYQWAGVRPHTADWIGAGTAAAFMTTMEYIDGRRKNDEASYSDFAANFLGAGLALAKPRWHALQDFELRLSYRTLSDPFDRKRMKRYDRMTHWLTYDLQRRLKLPLHVGLGYSVQRAGTPRAKAEYFFGVGISPQALVKNVLPAAASPLRWLDLYHFGNQVPINEAGVTTRKAKRAGK